MAVRVPIMRVRHPIAARRVPIMRVRVPIMAVSVPIMRVRLPIAARRVPIAARGQSSSRLTGNAASCQYNTCHAAGGAHGIACERVARCMRCCDRNGLADAATAQRLRAQAHTQGAQAHRHSLTGTGARLRTDANSHAGGSCSSKSRRLRRSARGAGSKTRPSSGALPCLPTPGPRFSLRMARALHALCAFASPRAPTPPRRAIV